MSQKVCVFLWNNFMNDARVRREVRALTLAGYNVDVICTYDGDEKELFQVEDFANSRVIRVWNFRTLKLLYNNPIVKILDKIKVGKVIDILMVLGNMIAYGLKNKYDFYHCNDLKTLPQGFICAKVFRRARLIYDSHEVETSRAGGKSKIKYIIERFLIKKADRVIMTTDTRADYNAKLYSIDKPEVIHNYPIYREKDESRYNLHQLLGLDQDEPILLYQGGFQVGRGIEQILRGTPSFKKGVVVFIGDGPLKPKMQDIIVSSGLEERVKIVPKVPAEELLYYTQHAYLGFQVLENTCFNHYSALSNKLLEYIMMEVPVVCSDLPEMRKIMNEVRAGLCIDTDDYENIVQAVNTLLEDKETYNKMKQNCADHKGKYTWDKEQEKFIEIYNQLGV